MELVTASSELMKPSFTYTHTHTHTHAVAFTQVLEQETWKVLVATYFSRDQKQTQQCHFYALTA